MMQKPKALTPRAKPAFDWTRPQGESASSRKPLPLRLIGLGAVLAMLCALYLGPLQADATAVVAAKKVLPVYSVEREDPVISVTFDASWGGDKTMKILDLLDEYNAKATFFLVGIWVDKYPELVKAIAERGHEIGNHTFSHRKFDRMGAEELRREIFSCEEAISSVSDAPVRYIRPPEGQMSDTMRQVIGDLDYRVILWDVDTRDWAHTPPETISRHILDTVQAGDIILMHDFIGYDSPTPEALRLVIPALLARGFRFVTVGELVEAE